MSGKYALIIANTEYTDSGLAQLTAPGRDADDFARVLREKDLCAFDDVKVLLNEHSNTINEAIDEFFDQKKPEDLLLLYFSGHGVRDELGALYLAVKNTNRYRLRVSAVKSDFIKESMDQSRSRRQVLILDCCNSGAFSQGTKAEIGGSIGTKAAFEGTGYGRVVLTASDATQFAWEGDKVIGGTDNSLFTHFLIKGLEGDADINRDGKITVDDLYDYAYEQIVLRTPKQTPGKWSYKQQGEITIREHTEEEKRLIQIFEAEEKNRIMKEEIVKREQENAERAATEKLIAQLQTERKAAEREVAILKAERETEEKVITPSPIEYVAQGWTRKILAVANSLDRLAPAWLKAITIPTDKNYEQLTENPKWSIWLILWWVLLSGPTGTILAFGFYLPQLFDTFLIGSFFGICSIIGLIAESLVIHVVTGGKGSFGKLIYLLALINTLTLPAFIISFFTINDLLFSLDISWYLPMFSILLLVYVTFLGIFATKTLYKLNWGKATLAGLCFRLIFLLTIGLFFGLLANAGIA